eukprot:GHVT01066982.1.p1 GENE.GHVT01066982.1~~GHVT01066982.1.p1  ORF type:complete len:269 (-),score=85.63 GHVT01066982.1:346-1152(-)
MKPASRKRVAAAVPETASDEKKRPHDTHSITKRVKDLERRVSRNGPIMEPALNSFYREYPRNSQQIASCAIRSSSFLSSGSRNRTEFCLNLQEGNGEWLAKAGVTVAHFPSSSSSFSSPRSGCSSFIFARPLLAAGKVFGAAPATRDFEALQPGNSVSRVHGLFFTGRSAFGLDGCSELVRFQHERGRGVDAGLVVPVCPAAAIFDFCSGSEEEEEEEESEEEREKTESELEEKEEKEEKEGEEEEEEEKEEEEERRLNDCREISQSE